jgi:tetratricopeptide (TPR) repeat protein
MAENPLEGLIGGEGDEGPDAPGGGAPDAVAMGVAMDAARFDPELSRKAGAYLEAQQRLVKIQTEHLHEQRAVQITHLRLRVILESFVVAVVAAVVIALGVMVWNATQDHGLVVEAFSVPPDLAQRGVTGQVAAKQVLDRLAKLQAETVSVRPSNSYRNNWNDDLKVEIPETGVSLGEVQRLLNSWLGHETHISGEIFHSPTGLTITVRAGEDAAEPASGPDANLDGLIQRAAEAIYRQTQPYRYATYLYTNGKAAEAKAIFEKLTTDPRPLERAWAYVGLEDQLLGQVGIPAIAQNLDLAARAEPDMIHLKYNRAQFVEIPLGHDESALKLVRYARTHKEAYRRELSNDAGPQFVSLMDILAGDEIFITHNALDGLKSEMRAQGEGPLVAVDERPFLGGVYGLVTHDPAEVRRAMSEAHADEAPSTGGTSRNFFLAVAAFEAHDPASVGLLEGVRKADETSPGTAEPAKRDDVYWLALAKARFGDVAAAKALIFATPTDCYGCVMGRGQILAMAGDRAGAEPWFAEAIHQGPDIPLAFTARGEARLGWGDVAGALADGQAATKLSPNDPDALKLWGDALARQDKWRDAREKYDAALKLAPNWAELRQARAAAAKR